MAGRFTIRTTAVIFWASGLFECFSVTEPQPLAGAMRGGVAAIVYHLVYAALFLALGTGLWLLRRWGYRLVFAATALYTLDRFAYLLDDKARRAEMAQSALLQTLEPATVGGIMNMAIALTVLSWWGLAFYIFLRRANFTSP